MKVIRDWRGIKREMLPKPFSEAEIKNSTIPLGCCRSEYCECFELKKELRAQVKKDRDYMKELDRRVDSY